MRPVPIPPLYIVVHYAAKSYRFVPGSLATTHEQALSG